MLWIKGLQGLKLSLYHYMYFMCVKGPLASLGFAGSQMLTEIRIYICMYDQVNIKQVTCIFIIANHAKREKFPMNSSTTWHLFLFCHTAELWWHQGSELHSSIYIIKIMIIYIKIRPKSVCTLHTYSATDCAQQVNISILYTHTMPNLNNLQGFMNISTTLSKVSSCTGMWIDLSEKQVQHRDCQSVSDYLSISVPGCLEGDISFVV